MSETAEQLPEVNEDWLATAVVKLQTTPASSRFACMGLAPPVFNDLARKIIQATRNGQRGLTDVWAWLAGEVPDAPARASFFRFANALLMEYAAAAEASRDSWTSQLIDGMAAGPAGGDVQRAASYQLAKRLLLLVNQVEDLTELDPKTLDAVVKGVRYVNMTNFDEAKLEKDLKRRELDIQKRELDLEARRKKAEAELQTLAAKASGKKTITPDDIQAVRKAIFG